MGFFRLNKVCASSIFYILVCFLQCSNSLALEEVIRSSTRLAKSVLRLQPSLKATHLVDKKLVRRMPIFSSPVLPTLSQSYDYSHRNYTYRKNFPYWIGGVGAAFVYSQVCIQLILTFRYVFKLALRQMTGFITSLFASMKKSLPIPELSRLSKRAFASLSRLPLPDLKGATHLVLDSSGLKVFGKRNG